MEILAQSALILSIACMGTGLTILSRDVRNKLYQAYFVLQITVAFWALFFFLEQLYHGGVFYRFHLMVNIWLGPVCLTFLSYLIPRRDAVEKGFFRLALGISSALSLLLILGQGRWWLVQRGMLFAPFPVVLRVVYLLFFDRVDRALRARRNPELRVIRLNPGQVRALYLGSIVVLCLATLDHIEAFGTILPAIANLVLTLYLFFLGQSVSLDRAFHLQIQISRIFGWIFAAMAAAGLYAVIEYYARGRWALFLINAFMVTFFLMMVFSPIRLIARTYFRRYLNPNERLLRDRLTLALKDLVGIVDERALFEAVAKLIDEVLSPQRLMLYLRNSGSTRFVQQSTRGKEPGESCPKEILTEGPVFGYVLRQAKKNKLPVLIRERVKNELDHAGSEVRKAVWLSAHDLMSALESNVVIPLVDGDRVLGFFAINVVRLPTAWQGSWMIFDVLYPYFERVAQTVQSLEVFVQQREQERLAALGIMAAGLAHEIRNPLGAIKGATQFLDPSLDRPESRFLQIILDETDRLNRVVTRFLDYSKPQNLNLRPVDLISLVRDIVQRLKETLKLDGEKLGERLQFNVMDELRSAPILAEPDQIHQILLNLIQNSIRGLEKISERAQIEVSIRRPPVVGENSHDWIALVVWDNGQGIARENFEKLFIPFFTTSTSGTGLGLSITQKIIEAHRGKIEIESEQGEYTRVVIQFPLRKKNEKIEEEETR